MRIHPRILQIGCDFPPGGHVKLYLIEGEQTTLIDTGVQETPEKELAPYLAGYGYSLADIDLILNTHGHRDHAGGNLPVQRASNAPIYLHAADVAFVEDPRQHFDEYVWPVVNALGDADRADAYLQAFLADAGPVQQVDRQLQDGDRIDVGRGIELQVVHLPGHTPGSVGFYWEQEGILISGDSVQGQGSMPGALPIVYRPNDYQRSLARLAGIPIRMLCTGHFFESLRISANPIKKGGEVVSFLEDCREINNRILEAVTLAAFRHWGEPFQRIVATAVDELRKRLYLRTQPNTGLPPGAERIAAYYFWAVLHRRSERDFISYLQVEKDTRPAIGHGWAVPPHPSPRRTGA